MKAYGRVEAPLHSFLKTGRFGEGKRLFPAPINECPIVFKHSAFFSAKHC
jgi:hypothetical protein